MAEKQNDKRLDMRKITMAVNVLLQCQSVIGNQCCQISFLRRRNRCMAGQAASACRLCPCSKIYAE